MTGGSTNSNNAQVATTPDASSRNALLRNRDAAICVPSEADSPQSSTHSARSDRAIQQNRAQANQALGGSNRDVQVLTPWQVFVNASPQSSTGSEKSEASIQRHRTQAALTLGGNNSWEYVNALIQDNEAAAPHILPPSAPKKPNNFLRTISNKLNNKPDLSNLQISTPVLSGEMPLAAKSALPIKQAQKLRQQDPSLLHSDATGLQNPRHPIKQRANHLLSIEDAKLLRYVDPSIAAADAKVNREVLPESKIRASTVLGSHPPGLHNSAGEELPNTFFPVPMDQSRIVNRKPLPPSPAEREVEPKTPEREVDDGRFSSMSSFSLVESEWSGKSVSPLIVPQFPVPPVDLRGRAPGEEEIGIVLTRDSCGNVVRVREV